MSSLEDYRGTRAFWIQFEGFFQVMDCLLILSHSHIFFSELQMSSSMSRLQHNDGQEFLKSFGNISLLRKNQSQVKVSSCIIGFETNGFPSVNQLHISYSYLNS